jgi:hypothetical protein
VRFDQHLQRCNVNVQSGQGAAATSHSQQSARSLTRSIQDFRDEQEEIRRLEREVAKKRKRLELEEELRKVEEDFEDEEPQVSNSRRTPPKKKTKRE